MNCNGFGNFNVLLQVTTAAARSEGSGGVMERRRARGGEILCLSLFSLISFF
jgi:hypothetical protein